MLALRDARWGTLFTTVLFAKSVLGRSMRPVALTFFEKTMSFVSMNTPEKIESSSASHSGGGIDMELYKGVAGKQWS